MAKLTNQEHADAVARGDYPANPRVMLGDEFLDPRGSIRNILTSPALGLTSVARIRSRAGAVRANHVHATDWHYTVVEDGLVLYFERESGSPLVPDPHVFGPGQCFFTPPGREHAMLFAEDTVIYTFAKNERTHDSHEADLSRVTFITAEIARDVLGRYAAGTLKVS